MTSPFQQQRLDTLISNFRERVRTECPQNIHHAIQIMVDAGVQMHIINTMILEALQEMIFEWEVPEFEIEYHHTDCNCDKCRWSHNGEEEIEIRY